MEQGDYNIKPKYTRIFLDKRGNWVNRDGSIVNNPEDYEYGQYLPNEKFEYREDIKYKINE